MRKRDTFLGSPFRLTQHTNGATIQWELGRIGLYAISRDRGDTFGGGDAQVLHTTVNLMLSDTHCTAFPGEEVMCDEER